MKILNIRRQSAFFVITCLIALFPIFPYIIRSILTFVFVGVGLSCFIKNKNNFRNKKVWLLLFCTIAPFFYLVLSLIYSTNLDDGVNIILHMVSIVIFPVIFAFNHQLIGHTNIKIILRFFCASVVILVLYQIAISIMNLDFLMARLSELEIKRNNLAKLGQLDYDTINKVRLRRFRGFIESKIDTHSTYQGLWIGFSVCILVKEMINCSRLHYKVALGLLALILLIWLSLLSSRMPIFAIVMASMVALFISKMYSLKTYLYTSSLLVLLMVGAILISQPLKSRVKEVFQTGFELPTSSNHIETYNSINIRNGIYFCAKEIIKENFVLGVGIGDVQDKLNQCYSNKIGAKIYNWRNYNTHNQFLLYLISSGIFGLILYLISWYVAFRNGFMMRNIIFIYFLTLTFFISMAENILERSDGVIFFAFFNGLFLFNLKPKDP